MEDENEREIVFIDCFSLIMILERMSGREKEKARRKIQRDIKRNRGDRKKRETEMKGDS